MKKFLLLLASFTIFANPLVTVKAQETTSGEVTLVQGMDLVDQLDTSTYYQMKIYDKDNQVIFTFDDLTFTSEELEAFKYHVENSENLFIDLGDGQYRLPVKDISLQGTELSMISDEKIGYSVYFHEGLVTQSGGIYQDPTDPTVKTQDIESPDFYQWVIANSALTPEGPVMLTLDGVDYWSTLPYFTGLNGQEIDQSKNILVGALTLTPTPIETHYNLVPRVEGEDLTSDGQTGSADSQSSIASADSTEATEVTEVTEASAETSLVSSSQASTQVSETQAAQVVVETSQLIISEESTTLSGLQALLPRTGESGSWLPWLGGILFIAALVLIVLPKIRKK